MKSYKQKYDELLIKQHEKRYLHIPFSWDGIGRFFALLGTIALAIVNFFIIMNTWKLLNLGSLDEDTRYNASQLLIIYPLIGEYVLIGLSVICLVALLKGGFSQLKGYDEEGLISRFFGGFIVGLIGGLIGGLIVGLIAGLIWGLIVGLIGGLIWGLIWGLIVGLMEEFQ